MSWLMWIPILLGIGVCKSWIFFPMAIVSIFCCVGWNKKCKSLEEVWIFVLSFFTLLPATVRIMFQFLFSNASSWLLGNGLIGCLQYILQFICYFMMIMSIQIVVMLVIGKLIWPEKKKVRG